ncbi:hypothetical protein [Sinorhizobium fredii]|uniref:hypothetical protein n=1 Tax=Rhizobium fredii TaxID=380 RepID=UPI0023523E97|nr:hypothetical protein [Sinorhizobium fredii]
MLVDGRRAPQWYNHEMTCEHIDSLLSQTRERIANGWRSSEIDALMPWNYAR